MKEFIQVTEASGNIKVLLPTSKIFSISEHKNGGCFIETGVDHKGESLGMFTVESYDEILQKLSAEHKEDLLSVLKDKIKNQI